MNTMDWHSLPSALAHFEDVARALIGRSPALFIDYDGTLTPIVSNPKDAVMSHRMQELVKSLADCCTVAVISGRDRRDVESKVGLKNLIYAGSHGFDISGPGGLSFIRKEGEKSLPDLDRAEEALSGKLAAISGVRLERKKFALAVHFRNAPPGEEGRIQTIAEQVAKSLDTLKTGRGKKIIELKPDVDWNKGHAVNWLMKKLDLDLSETTPVYLGDDITDEDALAAVAQNGLGILVGHHGDPTHARFGLKDVQEVEIFLKRIKDLIC